MKSKATIAARILMGFIFFGAGIAALFNLVPQPTDVPERMQTYMAGIMATGYFFTLLKCTEVVCGAMLLSGFFVPLALVILAPVTLNIFLVHAFIDPKNIPVAIVLGILQIYLSFFAEPYSAKIKSLFQKK